MMSVVNMNKYCYRYSCHRLLFVLHSTSPMHPRKKCALISKSAGGIGVAISNVRASGSYIRGTLVAD